MQRNFYSLELYKHVSEIRFIFFIHRVKSQDLWSRHDRHFVGMKCRSERR